MTSGEDDAFIDAILAAPDDDAPRLVYADALTERGDPRGEFISVQCARARLRKGTPEHFALLQREKELTPAAPSLDALRSYCTYTFERGFIADLRLTTYVARNTWPELVRMPIARMRSDVDTFGKLSQLALLAEHPTVKTIETHAHGSWIHLDAKLLREALASGDHDATAWASPGLPNPRLFPAIVGAWLYKPTTLTFLGVEALPSLTEVWFAGDDELSPAHIPRVCDLPQLETLMLHVRTNEHALALLGARPPPRLRRLELGYSSRATHPETFSDEVVAALAKSPLLPQLESLLVNLRIDERLVEGLDARASNLRVLYTGFKPTAGGLERLFRSTTAQHLEELSFAGTDGRATDADRPPSFAGTLPRLQRLQLINFAIDDDAARALVRDLSHVPDLGIEVCNVRASAKTILRERWPALP